VVERLADFFVARRLLGETFQGFVKRIGKGRCGLCWKT
jgi:hypothetical protein